MMRRQLLLPLAVSAIGIGLAAEAARFSWEEPALWLPDLFVGWAMVACGLTIMWRRSSGTGPLLVLAGLAWFLGNFAAVEVSLVSGLASQLVYLHRAILVHAVLAFPSWFPPTLVSRLVVVAAYASSLVVQVARNDVATIALGIAVVAAAAWDVRVSGGPARRRQAVVLRAAVGLGVTLAGSALARLIVPGAGGSRAVLLMYQAALVALAVGLLLALLLAAWERTAFGDLVVELAGDGAGSFDASLARALGDPTLQLGYWAADRGSYVDAAGHPVELPTRTSGRAVTPVHRDGEPVAVLIHDPALVAGAGLGDAVSTAAALSASNARLQAQVRDQVAQVQESRRRLLVAGAEERQRLEHRMRVGAGRRLEELASMLTAAQQIAAASERVDLNVKLDTARHQLRRTRTEMNELARGLYPPALVEGGLTAALSDLVKHSAQPVHLLVSAPKVPTAIAAVAYFFVSEALSNVVKYANASVVNVTVATRDSDLLIQVTDDGVGGADPDKGSGLRGLADRVEALAGSVRIDSPTGGGTRLAAEIPLSGQP
jgi:signal transduction histidine kinase